MRAVFQVAVLLHILTSHVVKPLIRQVSSTGSSVPAPFPRNFRRRTSSADFIRIYTSDGSSTDEYEKGGLQSGIMMTLERSLQAINLEGLNNQEEIVEQAHKPVMFTKDRREGPSLISRLSERNKKVMIEEITAPDIMLRIFSLSMSLPANTIGEDSSTHNGTPTDFSMSMKLIRTKSADTDLAIEEERDFFLRSGSLSMLAALPQDREILQFQMKNMCMSMDLERRPPSVRCC
jgi:hypothetical protein